MPTYEPCPFDTSAVELPPGLAELTEQLAAHVHEVWARERADAGWTYGPVRDDVKKHNPTLVPYAELPESEKVYDRKTALGAIKFILAHGYRIEKSA